MTNRLVRSSRSKPRSFTAGFAVAAALGLSVASISASAQSAASTPKAEEPHLSGGRPVLGPPPGLTAFKKNCAGCHTVEGKTVGGREVPSVPELKAMGPGTIYAAMTTGYMVNMAADLTDLQKREVAAFVAGKPFLDKSGTSAAAMTNQCSSNPALGQLDAIPSWNGWSPGTNNARHQNAAAAGLTAADVPKLKLKWAFGLPGGGNSRSQPSIVFGRVFVGSDNRNVYSLNAKTGCVYWSHFVGASGRFAPVIGPISGYSGTRYAMYYVTGRGTAVALDAHDGKLLWKTEVKGQRQGVSASAALYDGVLYIPFTGSETVGGSNPNYPCCRSRGGVAALDANTGKVIWKVDSIQTPLHELGPNPKGVMRWGPSGASVWNTPTIDPKRHLVYVGTGNSYGPVAAKTSDSILALSMKDGHIVWHHQEFKGDAFMLGCPDKSPAGRNCPQKIGFDWDFGGSSAILQTLADGQQVLVAAGKGGIAIGLDPDNGKLLWSTKLFEDKPPPTADGLVIFGGTADGKRVYYPLQSPGGGIAALQLANGKIDWKVSLNTDPRGEIGPASSIPGVVFSGAWDGVLRAVNSQGKMIWSFDTRRSFDTVNGVPAEGGSLGSPGPTIANGMVFVASGYKGMQGGTAGNVILAFAVE